MSGAVTSGGLPTGPLAEASRRQGEASAPGSSAWVSANAGSGKTHVLAQRVIRLMLAGTPPGRILCLTYTKAAAANMANRVLSILGRWVALDDAALDAELARMEGNPPDRTARERARRLFAAALETPGGLKIQTIHAFCGGLLHRFPFEAGVAAGFRELDEAGRLDLMARIRADLVVEAAQAPRSPLGRALSRLMEERSDAGLDALLEAAVAMRADILPLADDAAGMRARLARVLGLDAGEDRASVEARILAGGPLPRALWGQAATLLLSGSQSDQDLGTALAEANTVDDPRAALAAYLSVFLTDKGQPRSAARFVTKPVRARAPDMAERLDDEKAHVADLVERLRACVILERSEAALTLAGLCAARYEAAKAERGLLDFDDLIARTAGLLDRVPASFVHLKLDRGIDHVLVDEAQDTSPAQWEVVQGLISDFFAGEGARGTLSRTLFVVGDEKQSIFSFQGADPRAFGAMHGKVARAAGREAFRDVSLPHSFRSAPGVLEAVDKVFASAEAHAGLVAEGAPPPHAAIRADAPALIEIWPTVTPAPRPKTDDWRRPLDEVPVDDPVNILARRIAAFVQWGIRERLAIPSRGGRPMQARDVMVLVRRRGKLFEAVIRALKGASGVEVAGADRLVVADHIAALDLMALGDALLSPDDDLALAAVLKSPLFGLTDDDLLDLCPNRDRRLRAVLRGEPRFSEMADRLERWEAEARALRPFDFYARVLGRDGGRRAMLARLGPEAGDVLDEFMALARAYESSEPASLPGFLAFLRRGGAETKRDMESGRDEVRVMTVHGAKGLEAPIVILADTVDAPRPRLPGGLMGVADADGTLVPVLASRKEEDPPAMAEARAVSAAREAEEYRRLLYVALTRAEDAILVCGAETRLPGADKPHARAEGCWYDLVRDALAREAVEVQAGYAEGPVLRWRRAEAFAPSSTRLAALTVAPPQALPLGALDVPAPRLRLRPSRASHAGGTAGAGARTSLPAADLPPSVRGDLIHRLLAGLPDLPVAEREAAGLRLLRQAAPGLPGDLEQALLGEAMGVIGHRALAHLFGAGSRAEVPVTGAWRTEDGRAVEVAGRMDRIVRLPDRLVIADFKTDRVPSASGDAVSRVYELQLGLYAAALRRAFSGLSIEAILVYTRGPAIHEIPASRLAAASREAEAADRGGSL
ncbi:double-strand break repair helicase AddA [Aquabacter cavernae]|uniref:double-strand break repair helicase AddA n=1 Tax=Aquabacter cavernae TaxID=2496029 RepID=UPI0013DFA8C5|nr:double-strand break repair helicase AddA [Aquabacter cavernae]